MFMGRVGTDVTTALLPADGAVATPAAVKSFTAHRHMQRCQTACMAAGHLGDLRPPHSTINTPRMIRQWPGNVQIYG